MVYFNKEDYHLHLLLPSKIDKKFKFKTSNNQSLRSGGDNDRRSKRFYSIAMRCASFTWQIVKIRVIWLRVIEGPNARDVKVQANVTYMQRMHNNNLEIWIAGSSCRVQQCAICNNYTHIILSWGRRKEAHNLTKEFLILLRKKSMFLNLSFLLTHRSRCTSAQLQTLNG